MDKIPLVPNGAGHASRIVHDLLASGWKVDQIPADGKVPRNGIKLVLKSPNSELRARIFAYKVTTSGRSRPHERRIEITSTHQSGIQRARSFTDIVLGIDTAGGKYVGVDSRRMRMGGATHNASSFFDIEGLSARDSELMLIARRVNHALFPESIEQHAFFGPTRLAEYLFNHSDIHLGRYSFQGSFSGQVKKLPVVWPNGAARYAASGDAIVLSSAKAGRRPFIQVSERILGCVEERDLSKCGRKLSPEQLKEIQAICDEIGSLGEQCVLDAERRRLRKRGLIEAAHKVERVSLKSVGEGYDILSFEDDGVTKRYLEVKATVGSGSLIDVSKTEWKAAQKLGEQYYFARVVNVRKKPDIYHIRNPAKLEKDGKVFKTAAGWTVDLTGVMK